MRTTPRPTLRLLPLAAAVLLHFADTHAATIAVNDPATTSVTGKCTLTDAVSALNQQVSVNACVAGDGNQDIISLAFFQSPTTIAFTLPTSADGKSALAFDHDARITGNLGSDGKPLVTIARSTVSGTPKFRVIDSTALLKLNGIAISGGDSLDRGAGISHRSDRYSYLSLVDSTISGNTSVLSGGAISADCAQVYLRNSTVSGNSSQVDGGGIYSASKGTYYTCYNTLILHTSTISDNTATKNGGGVYNFAGLMFLHNTTLSGNTGYRGGAVAGYGHINTTNVTFAGNHATKDGGAIYCVLGNTYTFSSTINANTVGDVNGTGGVSCTSLRAFASIITGNANKDVSVVHSDITPANYQLYGSNNILGVVQAPNSATGTLNCNPNLGPLADNGGPTLTMVPGSGSCAIDAGPVDPLIDTGQSDNPIRTDQRGMRFLRKSGSATDIGAVEAQPAADRIFFDGFDSYYTFAPGVPGIIARAQ